MIITPLMDDDGYVTYKVEVANKTFYIETAKVGDEKELLIYGLDNSKLIDNTVSIAEAIEEYFKGREV